MDLWIPKSLRPKWQCNIPGCGAKFGADEHVRYTRHVARCAALHGDRLRGASEARKAKTAGNPLYEPVDPEAADYLRRRYGKGARR